MIVINDRLRNGYGKSISDNDLLKIHRHMESINRALMVIAGNLEVVKSLRGFYYSLKENEHIDFIDELGPDLESFTAELRNIENAFEGERDRCIYLFQVVSGRKELVRNCIYSNNLKMKLIVKMQVSQHLQSQTNGWMLREARESRHQAIVMKIIAGVTLFYLPATFVSTFFSTDVIKYQGVDSPVGNYSSLAMERWGEVTAGLTVLTLLIALAWWAWSSWDRRKQQQEEMLPLWEKPGGSGKAKT